MLSDENGKLYITASTIEAERVGYPERGHFPRLKKTILKSIVFILGKKEQFCKYFKCMDVAIWSQVKSIN